MKSKRNLGLTAGVCVLFCAAAAGIMKPWFLSFVNLISLLSLGLLVIGLVDFLINQGYLDLFAYSVGTAKDLFSRRKEKLPQSYSEYRRNRQPQRQGHRYFVLKLALILLGFSILMTVLYEVIC